MNRLRQITHPVGEIPQWLAGTGGQITVISPLTSLASRDYQSIDILIGNGKQIAQSA